MPLNEDQMRRIDDYLHGLLEDEEASEVEDLSRHDPVWKAALAEARRRLTALQAAPSAEASEQLIQATVDRIERTITRQRTRTRYFVWGTLGTIAAGVVARATPDGYTLLMGHASTNTIAPALYAKLPFDPYKDFVPVTLAGSVPHLVSVHPSVPARTIKELIALAKASPGKWTTPSSGHGSMSHVAGALFMQATGTEFVHVPYKGAGLSMQDLIAGHVKVSFDTTPAAMPHSSSRPSGPPR